MLYFYSTFVIQLDMPYVTNIYLTRQHETWLEFAQTSKVAFYIIGFRFPFFSGNTSFHILHEIMLGLCTIVLYLVDFKVQVILKSNTSFPFPLLPRIETRSTITQIRLSNIWKCYFVSWKYSIVIVFGYVILRIPNLFNFIHI